MILVIASHNTYASKRLLEEAKKQKIALEIFSVGELLDKDFKVNVEKYKTLYIRDPYVNQSPKYVSQVIKLAKKFKLAGKKVVDANIADGMLSEGKWVDYQKLMRPKLSIPTTTKLESRSQKLGHPFILKWCYGMGSKNVFLIPSAFTVSIELANLDETNRRFLLIG